MKYNNKYIPLLALLFFVLFIVILIVFVKRGREGFETKEKHIGLPKGHYGSTFSEGGEGAFGATLSKEKKPHPKSHAWSSDLIDRFMQYQSTVNRNVNQFDMKTIQEQATPEEGEHLLKTSYWPWDDETKYTYLTSLWTNTVVKINPNYALDYAMQLYNETAAKRLIGWNTKEGKFLLRGGDLGVSEGMPDTVRNSIQCAWDKEGNEPYMEKTVYKGYNLWNGYKNVERTKVKNEDIPKEMKGFQFVKQPCNPCLALKNPPDYSCPFTLNVQGDNSMSSVWKEFWAV